MSRSRGWIILGLVPLLFAGLAAAQDSEVPTGDYGESVGEVEYGAVTLGYGPDVPKYGEDIYRIVRGDTLWGICGRFFGDSQTWPGLWSINNEEITNPHYIYPGQVIRFTPGTDIRPPQLTVGEEGPGSYEYDEEFQNVVRFLEGQQECGVDKEFSMREYAYRVTAPGFIVSDSREKEAMHLGEVYAAPEMGDLLGLDMTVYLEYDEDDVEDVNCGDIYTIYREVHEVRHPYVRRAKLGMMYRVVGEVLITDVNLRTNIATAKIIEDWIELARGDLVTDRIPVASMITERQVQGQVEGYIVDKLNEESRLAHPREVVFIDRGRNSGVEEGTVFWVMHKGDPLATRFRDRKKNERLPQFVVGKLVVYSVDDSFSTAVLVDSNTTIHTGDHVYTVVEEADLR